MSILITGMEMPKERESFTLTIKFNGLVVDTETGIQVAEAQEVPPHGRLIDADAMIASVKRQTDFLKVIGGDIATLAEVVEKGILQEIENAPTIIPAEEETNGET